MKKDKEGIYKGLLFGGTLYLLGAIDFTNPISYIFIIAIPIIIGFSTYRIVRRILQKKPSIKYYFFINIRLISFNFINASIGVKVSILVAKISSLIFSKSGSSN